MWTDRIKCGELNMWATKAGAGEGEECGQASNTLMHVWENYIDNKGAVSSHLLSDNSLFRQII
jgi:hypothetical protein